MKEVQSSTSSGANYIENGIVLITGFEINLKIDFEYRKNDLFGKGVAKGYE